MNRKIFIRITGLGLLSAFGICLLFAENKRTITPVKSGKTKVVVARGNNLASTFDHAMIEWGGLQPFIKKRQKVTLKPEMSIDALPEEGLTTNPQLIKYISRQCYKMGSGRISTFDHCIDSWTKCYKNSEIERLAKNAKVKVVPGNNERYFTERKIEGATVLTKAHVHVCISQEIMLIDIPILKRDDETTIYGGIKNLMGCVSDHDFYLKNGQDICLAEFLLYKIPELTVIDASFLLGNKAGETVLIISTDVLAADAVACRMLGIDPNTVSHLKIAANMGLGIISETEIDVKDIETD